MDAVMLIEVLDQNGHAQTRHLVRGAGGQCSIGRSLTCDVTLDDAHAAAQHVLLTLQHDGRVLVQDLGTRNGTRIDGELIDSEDGRIISKGNLWVGRTRVRVRTEDGPLPPERVFRRDFLRRYRTLLSLGGLLMCVAFAAFLQWTFAPEALGQRVLIAELLAVAGIAVWAGAWSLISRLTVGAWKVRIHLALAAFCVGLWLWGYWLYTLGAFALQARWLLPLMVLLAAGVAWAVAFLHVRNATHFRRLPSLLLAAFAPLICGGVWWLVDLQIDPRTVNRVQLGAQIQPPQTRLAPSTDLADFLADAADLKREANRNRQLSLLENPVIDLPQ